MIGVVRAERETQQRRDRTQRDVALLPGETQAEHLSALMLAHAHDAGVRNRRRIGARVRIGEREAGNLQALGKPRQVVTLLLIRAVEDDRRTQVADRGARRLR